MKTGRTYSLEQLVIWLALFVGVFFFIGIFDLAPRVAFDSHEVRFTDASKSGLHIMPASCSSSPNYYHTFLTLTDDDKGLISATGETEYGATMQGIHVCVTNSSGASYFIPANTAAEVNSFKNRSTSIPGVQSW